MATPKYQQIADEIRDRIRTGVYPPKSLVPDQNTLAKAFGVSRMTIKKALDGLASEGLIYKQSGLGTYVLGDVSAHSKDSPAEVFEGLTKQEGADHVTSQVIAFDVTLPSQLVRQKLELAPDEPVLQVEQVIWLTTGENIEYSTSRNLASWRGYTVLDINHE